ncbi:LVIVD repeat-containing protein [Candidatus Lokiarchaeum ossiferum]|uniref:LVIVD repeat-containing protein n=1 Tax=Candidatus Lokiarchaeum ossiferum TaxID=2951803 RepID=UPI00352F39EE
MNFQKITHRIMISLALIICLNPILLPQIVDATGNIPQSNNEDFSIELIGSYEIGGSTTDVEVEGSIACISDLSSGIHIVDVSDPQHPKKKGLYLDGPPADGPHEIHLENNRVYVADWYDGLMIGDISNPRRPKQLGQHLDGGEAYGIDVQDEIAYLGDAEDGFEIINVTDPSNPVELAQMRNFGFIGSVFIQESLAFILEIRVGLHIINVSDPEHPVLLSSFSKPTATRVIVKQDICFLAAYNQGLSILNITNASNPIEIGSLQTLTFNLVIEDDLLYTTGFQEGIKIYNISNVADPQLLTSYSEYAGDYLGIDIQNGYLFCTISKFGMQIFSTPHSTDAEAIADSIPGYNFLTIMQVLVGVFGLIFWKERENNL